MKYWNKCILITNTVLLHIISQRDYSEQDYSESDIKKHRNFTIDLHVLLYYWLILMPFLYWDTCHYYNKCYLKTLQQARRLGTRVSWGLSWFTGKRFWCLLDDNCELHFLQFCVQVSLIPHNPIIMLYLLDNFMIACWQSQWF